jgi:hypothetical protein
MRMWKNIVELGRPQMTIWRMNIACWILNATKTHSECVTHRFSTATVVARTHLRVTLYVHCLSCNRAGECLLLGAGFAFECNEGYYPS